MVHDQIRRGGAPITEGPIEAENGTRFIFTEDPDKYEIELMQYQKNKLAITVSSKNF